MRWIGSLFLVGALFLEASACRAGDGDTASRSGGGSASDPLDASTQAEVEQIVRQFQDTNNTPGVLGRHLEPKRDLRQRDGRR